MLVVKEIVYRHHRKMLTLYEESCEESGEDTYWGPDDVVGGPIVDTADSTNEVVRDDGF